MGRAAASTDRTEVVVTRDANGPVDTELVPTAWYQHTQAAKRQADLLREKLRGDPRVKSVGIGTTDRTIGGLKRKSIEVHVSGDDVPAAVPDSADGIEVEVDRTVSTEYLCYDGSYDPLEGGVTIDAEDGTTGSVCCRVYNGSSAYLLTARHIFTDNGVPCGSMPDPYAYRNGSQIGVFQNDIWKHDAVWFGLFSGYSISDAIVEDTAPMTGWVTEYGLDTYSSNDKTMYKRGHATCKETYTIRSYGHTKSLSCDPDHVDLVYYEDGNASGGDSGSPIYHVNNKGNAFLASLLSGETLIDCGLFCSTPVVFGSAAYAIHNEAGLNFD